MKRIKLNDPKWFDFSNGVDISNDRVEEMVNEVYHKCVNREEGSDYFYVAIGNTLVMCVQNLSGDVTIFLSKDYKSYDIDLCEEEVEENEQDNSEVVALLKQLIDKLEG